MTGAPAPPTAPTAPESWVARPRRRRLSPYARHRIWALVGLAVVGLPAFVIGGRYWVGDMTMDAALDRFASAGPAAHEPSVGLPAPGVYEYRTTGGEHISFLDYRRDYSSVTLRIVTRHGCGVREEQWFLRQHVEYYDRCGDALVAYGTDIAYWWTHGTQGFGCGPGSFDMRGRSAGARVEWHCQDEDTRAAQVTEYVGDEVVTVDGQRIVARHTRWTTTFSGATTGAAVVDDWFHPDTGLVLREHRAIGLRVGSPFVGRVTYADNSTYDLVSLAPTLRTGQA